MLAYRRTDVLELNAQAHAQMDRVGRLGPQRLMTLSGQELAPGDRVICRRNDPELGLTNGTRGRVIDVDSHRREVALATDRGPTIRVSPEYIDAGHLQLGYAITGHASQGLTVDRAFVLADPSGPQQEWAYVALSRARIKTRIYLAAPDLGSDLLESADGPVRPLVAFARTLQHSASEPLALNYDRRPRQEIDL